MLHPFDPGYVTEPYLSLCTDYPGSDVYPSSQFRVEWGPIFHRGRLDGSARVLVVGQDPAQHETIVRRILVGEAGRRVQGLLAKLGITRSYVFINTYLYSVYGSVRAATRRKAELVAYRNRWFDALLASGQVEAVIALGQAADEAWKLWCAAAPSPALAAQLPYAPLTHPTQPESCARQLAGQERSSLRVRRKGTSLVIGTRGLDTVEVYRNGLPLAAAMQVEDGERRVEVPEGGPTEVVGRSAGWIRQRRRIG